MRRSRSTGAMEASRNGVANPQAALRAAVDGLLGRVAAMA